MKLSPLLRHKYFLRHKLDDSLIICYLGLNEHRRFYDGFITIYGHQAVKSNEFADEGAYQFAIIQVY